MNKFNNDTIPFQNKVVCIEIPETIEEIGTAIEIIVKSLCHLYGLILAIFGTQIHYIKLNQKIPQKIVDEVIRYNSIDEVKENLIIIPFPKL